MSRPKNDPTHMVAASNHPNNLTSSRECFGRADLYDNLKELMDEGYATLTIQVLNNIKPNQYGKKIK